jgi:hypothetical protein
MHIATLIALAILLILFGMDDRQTLVIAQPGGWVEINPVARFFIVSLGAFGVHLYFAICIGTVAWGYFLLADFQLVRLVLVVAMTLAEGFVVLHNSRLGIKP